MSAKRAVHCRMTRKALPLVFLTIALAALTIGWGSTGHRFINIRANVHLPISMQSFIQDSLFFADHASDADARKGSDPTEGPKHYIDLENIPAFELLSRNLDSLIGVMGAGTVASNGVLPWATADAYDSLVSQLGRGALDAARLTASDIGHYVGDGHNPLHLTNNYDGQLTGNRGIHSRYESGMINLYVSELVTSPGSVRYIEDPFSAVLAYCIAGNSLADSIMIADDAAKTESGWSGSGTPPPQYYAALWAHTGRFTTQMIQQATEMLASLWYSAWVDAGLMAPTSAETDNSTVPDFVTLAQNYPNPFNPTTTIAVSLSQEAFVLLRVFDMGGREVAVLFEGTRPAGTWHATFEGGGLPSGVYVYQLRAQPTGSSGSAATTRSRRMILLR
jgi:hypothetical protein